MIAGVGADIVAVERFARLFERHGGQALTKILAPEEIEAFKERFPDVSASAEAVRENTACADAAEDFAAMRRRHAQARFLAKRFAAKEALGKAFGIGISAPLVLPAVAVTHDARGKPGFSYAPELAAWIEARGVTAQLSLSDERDYAIAFVILEKE